MQDPFYTIYHKAVCVGCPFSTDVASQLTCQKFKNGGIMMSCEDVTSEMCDKLAESDGTHITEFILNQLKLSQVKLGMGFLIEPSKGDPGEGIAMLVGPTGVVSQCKISELFPEETFIVLPSYSIFNREGEDITPTALKAFLQAIYEKAPLTVSAPFASLLDGGDKTGGE